MDLINKILDDRDLGNGRSQPISPSGSNQQQNNAQQQLPPQGMQQTINLQPPPPQQQNYYQPQPQQQNYYQPQQQNYYQPQQNYSPPGGGYNNYGGVYPQYGNYGNQQQSPYFNGYQQTYGGYPVQTMVRDPVQDIVSQIIYHFPYLQQNWDMVATIVASRCDITQINWADYRQVRMIYDMLMNNPTIINPQLRYLYPYGINPYQVGQGFIIGDKKRSKKSSIGHTIKKCGKIALYTFVGVVAACAGIYLVKYVAKSLKGDSGDSIKKFGKDII